ncbi:MAG: glycosyltransferase, partial [Traorella sp.]
MAKISIVIPVYNVENYLVQCLESVLGQTLNDIEVICVDDCSKDSSLSILNEYSAKDERLKVFHFEKSKSALQARKLGVLNSQGEYVMFLDADDYLEKDACEILYEKIKKEKVDILHFSSLVINCANLPQKRIDYNQKLIAPYKQKLSGKEVFTSCFVEKKYSITLWNKIFESTFLKKAFSKMEDKYLPKAQDLYSFYIIAYYAQSYLGWECKPLHNYCFGRGVTGTNSMNLDKFERYCTQANIAKALRKFSDENHVEYANEIIQNYYNTWINECVNIWQNELPNDYAIDGLHILYKYWNINEIVALIAKKNWYNRSAIAKKLKNMPQILLKEKKVKTVAFYYHHFTIGGVQRVISLLAPMFEKIGYKVVLIADNEPTENDIQMPKTIERVTIFNRDKLNQDNMIERFNSWEELYQRYNFDLVLYNAWTSNVLLWDEMYLKGIGIPVFIHAHSVFSFSVNKFSKLFYEMPQVFALADGMIVLSKVDKLFWDAFVKNVHYVPNPISSSLKNAKMVQWENHAIIWVGRVSNEKQPEAIFKIMERVVSQVNDAKIYLLGDFDESWQILAKQKNIENNVIFCGMVHNVNTYLEKAS